MAKIVRNANFFKNKEAQPFEEAAPQAAPAPIPAAREEKPALPDVDTTPVQLDYQMNQQVRCTITLLREMGMEPLAKAAEQARAQAEKERFTVAVAGEFSRGKSTFLNALLGSEVLPVGNLPTTALLTRIRYHEKPVLVYADGKGGKRSMPLNEKAWDGLTADPIDGNGPEGSALVGIPHPFLEKTCMELMDTPGAGDLDQARARVIGDALLSADGAIITVSATAALSESEKLFIEQRLIARKTPFLMLILTKMDQIPLKERPMVVDYVQKKLKLWGMDIPVYLPYQMEMPDDHYQDIMGMDKVQGQLIQWMQDPRRLALTQNWLKGRLSVILTAALDALAEKKALMDGDQQQRVEKIRQKKAALSHAEVALGKVEVDLIARCGQCLDWIREKADESADRIAERLEYEAAMAGNLQKWWQESYPYRMKIELTNMASAMEQGVSRLIGNDSKWLNAVLEQQVKGKIGMDPGTVIDKEELADLTGRKNVKLSNIDRQRMITRAGTTVLTIAGAMLCSSLGGFTLAATMGIGTGSSLISEQVFKGRIEKQREEIKAAIRVNVPELVETSLANSSKRIKALYDEMIAQAKEQQKLWLESQHKALDESLNPPDSKDLMILKNQIQSLQDQFVALQP